MLDFDPLNKLATWFDDNEDGTFNVTYEQNEVGDLVDGNRRLANVESFSKKGIKKGMWKYASIPAVYVMQWSKEIGDDILARRNIKELYKRLNNPDFSGFKTTRGKHSPKS